MTQRESEDEEPLEDGLFHGDAFLLAEQFLNDLEAEPFRPLVSITITS